jgi:hypothetical protein
MGHHIHPPPGALCGRRDQGGAELADRFALCGVFISDGPGFVVSDLNPIRERCIA